MNDNGHDERRQPWWAPFMIRLVLAMVFIVHGSHKLFDTFEPNAEQAKTLAEIGVIDADADGRPPTEVGELRGLHRISMMTHAWGWPLPRYQGWAAALTEFCGGILLLIGLLSRLAALGIVFVMGVAVFIVHWSPAGINIFHPEWTAGAGGWEFAGVCLLLALTILLGGPGRLSIDARLFGRSRPRTESGEEEVQV